MNDDKPGIPLSEVLKPPKVERSWSEDVPAVTGANEPIEEEFDRGAAILAAVKRRYQNPPKTMAEFTYRAHLERQQSK